MFVEKKIFDRSPDFDLKTFFQTKFKGSTPKTNLDFFKRNQRI